MKAPVPAHKAITRELRSVKRSIDANYALPLTLEALADDVNVEANELARSFRNAYGVTPTHYLTEVRVRAAATLLLAGQTAAAVSRACGFRTPAAFSAKFREITGIYASHYRFQTIGWKNGQAAVAARAALADGQHSKAG